MEPPLLFEQLVDHKKEGPEPWIALSELRRGSDPLAYADALEAMIRTTLRRPGLRLVRQPAFTWAGLESPCFRFELQRALMAHFGAATRGAEELFAAGQHEEAAKAFLRSGDVALRALDNLHKWTARTPELRGVVPPFHTEYLLSLRARAKCRAEHALFAAVYEDAAEGVETWKRGAVGAAPRQACRHAERACRYATLANLLWARPEGVLGVTTSADENETRLRQLYHHASSYCGASFQDRLDHAHTCGAAFADCQQVLDLNQRLYYLTPAVCPDPQPTSDTLRALYAPFAAPRLKP